MIIVLKIILGLLALANVFIGRFTIKDFSKVRKTDGFDNLSLWERIRFSAIFGFIIMALLSLFTFLVYFIIVPMQIL